MHDNGEFGRQLRQLRRARDLTQEALAQAAFCALDTIKKLESGRRRPSRQMAIQLADVLVLTAEERSAFLAAARHAHESDVPVAEIRQDEAPDAVTQLPHATPQTHRTIGLVARPSGTVTFLFTDIA